MAHCSTVLSQIVRIFPRHEFQALANKHHVGQKFRSFSPLDPVCGPADSPTDRP